MRLVGVLMGLGHPVAYYPSLNRITGSINATIFLCQLIYWTGKQQDPDGWIYKTQEDIESETGLGRRQQETARRHLVANGLLEEVREGMPARLFYRVNTEAIDAAWESGRAVEQADDDERTPAKQERTHRTDPTADSDTPDCPNPPDLQYTETTQRLRRDARARASVMQTIPSNAPTLDTDTMSVAAAALVTAELPGDPTAFALAVEAQARLHGVAAADPRVLRIAIRAGAEAAMSVHKRKCNTADLLAAIGQQFKGLDKLDRSVYAGDVPSPPVHLSEPDGRGSPMT